MNRERIERQRYLLVTQRDDPAPGVTFDMRMYLVRIGCGAAACAAGLMMLDPWCRDEGLETDRCGQPVYRGAFGFRALADFLEIDICTAGYLFDPASYGRFHHPTIDRVIARVEELLAGEEP
jgi:hypothetical protein